MLGAPWAFPRKGRRDLGNGTMSTRDRLVRAFKRETEAAQTPNRLGVSPRERRQPLHDQKFMLVDFITGLQVHTLQFGSDLVRQQAVKHSTAFRIA
jgi:hypothetical protein